MVIPTPLQMALQAVLSFDGDSHVDQNFMVTLHHGTVQVGPDNIQGSWYQSAQRNPDGAKWPGIENISRDAFHSSLHI